MNREISLITIAGGSASGKTSICREIKKKFDNIVIISLDSFYLGVDDNSLVKDYNFDHPSAFDWDLLINVLKDLLQGKSAIIPIYDFETHKRSNQVCLVEPAKCIILEGILSLYNKNIRNIAKLKIFVDTPTDIRLIRRIKRDIECRGRHLDDILEQYEKTVRASYDKFIYPSKKYADIIITNGKENMIGIETVCAFINKLNNQF